MILPDQTTVASQLSEANNKACEALTKWKHYDCEFVSDSDISISVERAAKLQDRLKQLEHQFHQRSMQMRFHFVRRLIARILHVRSLEWLPASLLFATLPCAGMAVILVVMKLPMLITESILVITFIAVTIVSARHLYPLDASEHPRRADELADLVIRTKDELARTKTEYHNAKERLEKAKFSRRLRREYEELAEEIQRLKGILSNRRYQLEKYDWRSLRGVPFESFIAEVFRELGYSVQMTKASGDQGVDLILTGKGSRIAVQTKGYADSVGNSAIQEVYAGMTYYDCNSCIAVTNSTFTTSARELAERVGCTLVDGESIPRLIHGYIL